MKTITIDKLTKLESGNYLLIFNPIHTNIKDIVNVIQSMAYETNKDDIIFGLLPSLKPESIRLFKVTEQIEVEPEK